MQRRTHEGPMDFQYDNFTGPMDGRSPFAQLSTNAQRNANANGNDRKRTFGQFGSPSKASTPNLREPAPGQQHFFSNAPKPLPALPHSLNPNFTTPRKLDTNDFESSGGETPKSPEHRDVDSDATPETMGFRSRFASLDTTSRPEFKAGGRTSPTKDQKDRRQSWWRSTVSKMSPLASSSARPKGNEYSHAAERKIMKKRNREVAMARRISISDDSDLEDTPEKKTTTTRKVSSQRQLQAPSDPPAHDQNNNNNNNHVSTNSANNAPPANQPHWVVTFFQFITNHPTLPHILSFYVQFAFNLFCIAGVMYMMYSFWATIRADVDKKSSEAIADLLADMAVCAQQYTDNRCARDTRVPAMEMVCNNWEKCMTQDPRNVGRARVSAHTFAEIFNGFIEPISYKAMIFSLILIFGGIGASNFAFSIFRDRKMEQYEASQQHHHYYGNGVPPPTPQRHLSGPDGGYWTPYHGGQQQPHGLEPAPSAFKPKAIEEGPQATPARRLLY